MCTNPLFRYYDSVKKDYRITNLVSLIEKLTSFGIRKNNIEKYLRCRFKDYQVLRCGRCNECKIKRSNDWTSRMLMEFDSKNNQGMMLTLTYDDSKLNAYNDIEKNVSRGISLIKADVQKFCKRFRKWLSKEHPDIKIKYYAVGEYGSKTYRPHYHIIILGYRFSIDDGLKKHTNCNSHKGYPLYECKVLNNLWKYGLCTISDISSSSIQYVCKYIQKRQYFDKNLEFNPYLRILNHNIINHRKQVYNLNIPQLIDCVPEFANMSSKTPIGYEYMIVHCKELLNRFNFCINPIKNVVVGLPKYFGRLLHRKSCNDNGFITSENKFYKALKFIYDLKNKLLLDKFNPFIINYEYQKRCVDYRIKNNFDYCPI